MRIYNWCNYLSILGLQLYHVIKRHRREWINIKMPSHYICRNSHWRDGKILWPSYLHDGISCPGKTTFLFWTRAQNICCHSSQLYSIDIHGTQSYSNPNLKQSLCVNICYGRKCNGCRHEGLIHMISYSGNTWFCDHWQGRIQDFKFRVGVGVVVGVWMRSATASPVLKRTGGGGDIFKISFKCDYHSILVYSNTILQIRFL